jgi:predicted  nucleic acid-binding Zn-ribbon protein
MPDTLPSGQNMQDTLKLLRGLQQLDRDLYRVQDELRRLPEERDRRRSAIDSRIRRRDEIEHAQRQLQAKIKEIEDMTTVQRQRVRKLESEVANARGDAALVAAFQHEMRALRRDISEAEEEGLELVERADGLQAEQQQVAAEVEEAEKDFVEFSGNVDSEVAEAEGRRDELVAQRNERIAGNLTGEVLTLYEKLLEAREGEALAALVGRVCQGCHVGVPSNIYVRLARAVQLVECPSCGRILYLPEED